VRINITKLSLCIEGLRVLLRKGSFFTLGFLWLGLISACANVGGYGYEPATTVTGEYLAGRLAARQNDHATAAKQFSRVQPAAPGTLVLREQAFQYHLLNGDFERAAELATQIARFSGPDQDLLIPLTIAVDDLRSKRYASARAELYNIKDSPAHEAVAFLLKGWALDGDKGTTAAIKHLKNPPANLFNGFTPLHLALLYDKAGLRAEAQGSYQVAFLSLGGAVGQRAFSEFLIRNGDEELAREASHFLLRRAGYSRILAKRNLVALEKGEKAFNYASLSPSQGGAIVMFMMGSAMVEQIYEQRNAATEAGFNLREPALNQPIAMMQLALALDPNLEEAQNFLGTLNNIHGQYDAAIAAHSKVQPSSIYYEPSQVEIANAYVRLENNGKAYDVLEQLIARNPAANEGRLILASRYAAEDRHSEAVALYDEAINSLDDNSFADDWRFYIGRAESLIQLGQWDLAEKDMKRAVEIAPEEPLALNYLGYSWAERGVNLEEAFALLEKALEKRPRSGSITDSLGWAHYQLGQYDEAVTKLEKAVSIEPGDPTITDHLGDVYWKLGRKIEARYEWSRALELDPDLKLKKSLQAKLETGLTDSDHQGDETKSSHSETAQTQQDQSSVRASDDSSDLGQ